MKTVHIIDYGVGNLLSVKRAFESIGVKALLVKNQNQFKYIDYLVLPGVGAFKHCSEEIKRHGLWDSILDFKEKERPFLGICIGMQLLMDTSYEFGKFSGFGFIKGKVDLLPKDFKNKDKIPFIGWKTLNIKKNSYLFRNNDIDPVYFVHSYSVKPDNNTDILCSYSFNNNEIVASIGKNHIYGVQFHPEKSARYGLSILERFVEK